MKKYALIHILLTLILVIACKNNVSDNVSVNYDRLVDKTDSPIGGGYGYRHIVLPKNGETVVNNLTALRYALANAKTGQIIFIPSTAKIDISKGDIEIPAGVTLASDRGNNQNTGALLYSNNYKTHPMIKVNGSDVRISGLRIQGPDDAIGDSATFRPLSMAISINGYDSLEVDNCEIYKWSYAGIYLNNSHNDYFHHNYIHDDRRTGFGYGIIHDGSSNSLIEANFFQANRHAIAGSGRPDQGYIARYNYVTESVESHSFDMHGYSETSDNDLPWAGYKIEIYENVFNVYTDAIHIRGIPKDVASIHDNYFPQVSDIMAIKQLHHFGHMNIYSNHFAVTVRGWYIYWSGKNDPYLYYQYSGPINDIDVVDFYSRRDYLIFKADGKTWQIFDKKTGQFQFLRNSPYKTSDLKFGDFNGDGTKDVFRVGHNGWYILYSGKGNWVSPLNIPTTQTEQLSNELKLGDFNGDGKTDVLRADSSEWSISYDGTEPLQTIRKSDIPADSMLIGDFNGDGTSDILTVGSNGWYVYWSGTGSPVKINGYTQYNAGNLRIGDFDGDGKSDVFVADGKEWMYSPGASKPFKNLRNSSIKVDNLRLGYLNDDNKTDILIISQGLWGN